MGGKKKRKEKKAGGSHYVCDGSHVEAMFKALSIELPAGVPQVKSFGNFFDEFSELQRTRNPGVSARSYHSAGTMNGGDEELVHLSAKQRAELTEDTQWLARQLQFMIKHCTAPFDDPADWPTSKLIEFLQKNGIDPKPRPPAEVLLTVAKSYISYCMECIHIITNMPDDDATLGAIGRKERGEERASDLPHLAKWRGSAKVKFRVLPQIAAGLDLGKLAEYPGRFGTQVFGIARGLYCRANGITPGGSGGTSFGINVYDEMLQSLESIAGNTSSNHSGKNVMCIVGDPDEQRSLAVVVLKTFHCGELTVEHTKVPLPLVAIKYLYSVRRDSTPETKRVLARAVSKGMLFVTVKAVSVDEVDLLERLLVKNRQALSKESRRKGEEKITEGWSFSVFRPADPSQKGIVLFCPVCGEPGKKKCAACKKQVYCSGKCQKEHWKEHKPLCILNR